MKFKNEHPHLAGQVDKIPDLMFADRAPATVKKYASAFQRWCKWAQEHALKSLPADPVGISVYLLNVASSSESASPVLSALHGIDWAHRKAGLDCPSRHAVLAQVVDGLKRQLARPAQKMQPLTCFHLEQLVAEFGQHPWRLQDLQMLSLITLGFRGFFRWSDLSEIHTNDIHFSNDFVSVFLARRKNDQFREGHIIPIARSESTACAVKWLERFLQAAGHEANAPLFGKVRTVGSKSCIREKMTYSSARERLKDMLEKIGLDASKFCLHSLRSGGASAALRTEGIPIRLVQRHGGWRRIESLEGYIEESLDNLLCVSRRLD